jgi:hypothetical protein
VDIVVGTEKFAQPSGISLVNTYSSTSSFKTGQIISFDDPFDMAVNRL